jgi:hypothetical protein
MLVPGDRVKGPNRQGGEDPEIITVVDVPLPVVKDVCVINYKVDDTPTYNSVLIGMDTFLNTQAPSESNVGSWKRNSGTYPLAIGDKVKGKNNIWYDVVNINCESTADTFEIFFSSGFPAFFIGDEGIAVMGDEGEPLPPPPPVPEFTTIGILIALLAITIGLGLFILKKK